MLVTEFSTRVVGAPERLALWEEATTRSHMRHHVHSNNAEDFRAKMRGLDLGDVQVAALAYPHMTIARTRTLIRQSDPEVYVLCVSLACEGHISLGGRDRAVHPGDLVVTDSSLPFQVDLRADPDRWSQVTVRCPRKLLPLPEEQVRKQLAVPISGVSGMGAVFTRWLANLVTRGDELTPADVPVLASATLDLLGSVVAGVLGSEKALSPEARRTALRARVMAFVEEHLVDPAMTPQMIADAHYISLRHLQQLFAGEGVSPAAWIRQRRLERCRRDLADPDLRGRPVQVIAARWGIGSPAHFSRLFRAAYGISPRDYREAESKACADRQLPCAD